MELYDIVDARPLPAFRAWVRFEDGLEGEVDLSHLVGRGVFARWSEDPAEFDRLTVDPASGTIVWPGGLDVAPDRLYAEISGRSAASSQP